MQHEREERGQPHWDRLEESNVDTFGLFAAQNNTGVMLLREKRYHDAANCFCQAVKFVNERSMYYCSQHADPKNCKHICHNSSSNRNNNENNASCCQICNDSEMRQRQSSSPLQTSTESSSNNEGDLPITGTSSSDESEWGFRSSPTNNAIESFYLLLDKDIGGSGSGSNFSTCRSYANNHDGCLHNACNEQCQKQCDHDDDTKETNYHHSLDDSIPEHKEAYMFGNPIVVSKRGIYSTMTRSRTIDKATCARLSLISVYNMALTYHLAALDSNSAKDCSSSINRVTESNINRNRLINRAKRKNSNEDVTTTMNLNTAIAPSPFATAAMPSSSSSSTTHPTKKQKVNHCPTNTTITPFGECETPYGNRADLQKPNPVEKRTMDSIGNTTPNDTPQLSHVAAPTTPKPASNDIPETKNSNNSCTASVDQALLSQALAYYQIAYRILVSDQRVLVSQAMVILNNIGHIYRLMGKEENAKNFFQRLLTTMAYVQQTGNYEQISHWDSFLTNVIDLIVSPEDSHKNFAPAA